MIVRWLLFETVFGELLLAFLERKVGLALVSADWLGEQPSGVPVEAAEIQ